MTTAKTCPRCEEPSFPSYCLDDLELKLGHLLEQELECDYVEPLPEDVWMRMQGAPELPGFDE